MGTPEEIRTVYRFAAFEVDSSTGEVRKSGIRIRVQEQPLKLLAALLERPGALITREELHRRLWPEHTFVDFEHGLNAAATRLRQALGDSAQNPRFIESVPRRGYRFIGQVERVETPGQASSHAQAMSSTAESPPPAGSHVDDADVQPALRDSRNSVRKRRIAAVLVWSCVVAAAVVSALYLVSMKRTTSADRRVSFPLEPPEETTFAEFDSMAVSPDGRLLTFTATDLSGVRHLWVRAFDDPRSRRLEGTEGASFPFWSPDSRSVGFFVPGKLKRVDLSGSQPRELCDAPDGRGGTWNRSGVIVFAPAPDAPLFQTSSTGSLPKPLAALDHSRHEITQRWPVFLPDSDRFLYMTRSSLPENTGIYIASLSSPHGSLLAHVQSRAEISRDRDGQAYIVFAKGPLLLAQRFDSKRGALAGDPFRVAEDIVHSEYIEPLHAAFATSEEGVLAYASNRPFDQLTWFERDGARTGTVGQPGVHLGASLARDGKTLAFTLQDPRTGKFGIWQMDLSRGALSELAVDRVDRTLPVWSPDGSRIAYGANVRGVFNMYERPSTGAGAETLIQKSDRFQIPTDWSPDGRVLLYFEIPPDKKRNILAFPLSGTGAASAIANTESDEKDAKFSPDGRWIVYTSDESGKQEVYVQAFPPSSRGDKWKISDGGGAHPEWPRPGNELYYLAPNRKIMAVRVRMTPSFEANAPETLFDSGIVDDFRVSFAVSAGGKRFLIPAAVTRAGSRIATVIVNWMGLDD